MRSRSRWGPHVVAGGDEQVDSVFGLDVVVSGFDDPAGSDPVPVHVANRRRRRPI